MPIEIRIDADDVERARDLMRTQPQRMKAASNRAIRKAVILIERETKMRSPVRTGLMRSSIQHKTYTQRVAGETFAGVRYAIFVELGTRFMRGRYFMKKAVEKSIRQIKMFFKEAVKSVAEGK